MPWAALPVAAEQREGGASCYPVRISRSLGLRWDAGGAQGGGAQPRHHWLGPALGISLVVLAAHGPAMKGRAADQASVWVDVWAGQQDFSRQHEPQRANTTERGSPTVRLSLGGPL